MGAELDPGADEEVDANDIDYDYNGEPY